MTQIIAAVPGPWQERTDLMRALARQGTDYMFAGLIFYETSTQVHCEFEFYPHDPGLRSTVEISGQGSFSEAELDAVAEHRSIAVLRFDDPGYEMARTAARFARALLEAGGLAAIVDSAGVAHTPARWLEKSASDAAFDVYSLFVTLVGDDERYYSCGMHNFGLPDAAVPAQLGTEEGAYLLNVFNVYQLTETPTLNTGETFSLEAGSQRFKLVRKPYVDGYDPESPAYNPHGLWSLELPDALLPPRRKRWRFLG